MRNWLFVLLPLLFAFSAQAESTWDREPGSGLNDCSFSGTKDRVCYADFDQAETSMMLDTRQCENYSAFWDSNIANETNNNILNVRRSLSPTVSPNTSTIIKNAALTGDPSTGLDSLQGFDGPFLYAEVITHVSGTGRLAVMCFKRVW